MDDAWQMKACQGLNRNSQPGPLSASLNQFDMGSAPFGHPYVQQEVCIIERTIRQEPLGGNLLNFGLQGPGIKSIRGDATNSLLALVPGSQHHVRSNYQPAATPRSPFTSSDPQVYQSGPLSGLGINGRAGHMSNSSACNRVSGDSSGHGAGASSAMLGREVNFSMLGREVNLSHYSRMAAGQECFESNVLRTSGVEMLKQDMQEDASDINGQSPVPSWLTEGKSQRQRVQNTQCSGFASGAGIPRTSESPRDCSTVPSSFPPFAPSSMRSASAGVVCVNYDTGQRIGGELCLSQSGLLGVLCSCHGAHTSVGKFVQHAGLYTTNPGNAVLMESTGESLVHWRRLLFAQYGVKVPDDNHGWDWSDADLCESGPAKHKSLVLQNWQKGVDVSCNGETTMKGRVTQVWDTPTASPSVQSLPSLANMNMASSLANGTLQDSTETFLKNLGRAWKGKPMGFESCPQGVQELEENVGRSRQGSADLRSFRNTSQLGANPSAEFFNFISGSQQFVSSSRTEQQVAVEQQIAVGSRSLLKGTGVTWSDGRETLQHEKDHSLSSFELRLGQPSQQPQAAGASMTPAMANQMQRALQRVLETGRPQQSMQSMTSAGGHHILSGHQGPANASERPFDQQNFARTSFMEANPACTSGAAPNRGAGMDGNNSGLVDCSFKRMEDMSTLTRLESIRERENVLARNAGQLSMQGLARWASAGSLENSLKANDGLLVTSDHRSRQWGTDPQHQIGTTVQPLPQGQQDLDTILSQEWIAKGAPSRNQGAESAGAIRGRITQPCNEETLSQNRPACPEAHSQDREHLEYEDVKSSMDARDRQSCACSTGRISVSANTNGGELSKLGHNKEVEVEGNTMETQQRSINGGADQVPTTYDCSLPQAGQLRSYQHVTSQGCKCGSDGQVDCSNEASRVLSSTGVTPAVVPAAENDPGVEKRFGYAEREAPKIGRREPNETFQWKETGDILVAGNETVAGSTQDDILPPRARLEEGLIVDAAGKTDSEMPVSSGASDKQPPVSDVCSKSSENAPSGFSDGIGAEEISNTQSLDKNQPVQSEVVDEGSGIGKSSSSDGVDMGLMPNLNISSKDEDGQKQASPSSQGYPTVSNGENCPPPKVGTRSRGGYASKEPTPREAAGDLLADKGKVERKRRTMKWRRLDAAMGATDAKRQKFSSPEIVPEIVDSPQKQLEGSDFSISLEHKAEEPSPSTDGKIGAVRTRRLRVTHGSSAPLHAENEVRARAGNGTEPSGAEDRYLDKTETLVIRVPQGVNRQKAKRSGRSKYGKKGNAEVQSENTRANQSEPPETAAVTPETLDSLISRESVKRGSSIPKPTGQFTKPGAQCPHLQVPPLRIGKVILGRPSPRNATRMVSLNDIMSKPEVKANALDRSKLAVLNKGISLPDRQDCAKVGRKALPAGDVVKRSAAMVTLEAPFQKDGLQTSGLKDSSRESSPRVGLKISRSKEPGKSQLREDGGKAKPYGLKDGGRIRSTNDDFATFSAKPGSKVFSTDDSSNAPVVKAPFGKEGSKVFPVKVSSKVTPSRDGSKMSFAKDELKLSSAKEGSKASVAKDELKSSTKGRLNVPPPRDELRASLTKDNSKLSSRNCVKGLSSTGCLKVSSTNVDSRLPSPRVGMHVASPPTTTFKAVSPSMRSKMSSPKITWKALSAANGLKASIAKESSKQTSADEGVQMSGPAVSAEKRDLSSKSFVRIPIAMDGCKIADVRSGSKLAGVKGCPAVPQRGFNLQAPASDGDSKGTAPRESLKSRSTEDRLKFSSQKPRTKVPELDSGYRPGAVKERSKISLPNDGSNTFVPEDGLKGLFPMDKLTAPSKPKTKGASVFDFDDEDLDPPQVHPKGSSGKPSVRSGAAFSVPVHFSDSKCIIPRGERSPRGKFARVKNLFWQRHKGEGVGGSPLAAEPVEIVIRRSCEQDHRLSSGTSVAVAKEVLSEAKLHPVVTQIQLSQKRTENGEQANQIPRSTHVGSSMVLVKEAFGERLADFTKPRSNKRIMEQSDVVPVPFKKHKLLESSVASEAGSGPFKIRHSLSACIPAPPKLLSSDVVASEGRKDKRLKRQAIDYNEKLSGRKKRCQRPRRFDCRVPEGVVECCVCGISASELLDQIVCCSQCPVKVHQACYGVRKIPNSAWFCRTCKIAAKLPICVLCGYGGGAMTRAQKANGFVKALVKLWQEKQNTKTEGDACIPNFVNSFESKGHIGQHLSNHQALKQKQHCNGWGSITENPKEADERDSSKSHMRGASHPLGPPKHEDPDAWMLDNTVTSGLMDSSVAQWVHMVCALWMPGTRCLNFNTMGSFDVSGVTASRRKLICTICKRKGGACIECRVAKCGIPFHAWCAHEKGLLQSEIVEDGSNQVGFYGKCARHGKGGDFPSDLYDVSNVVPELSGSVVRISTCARTEGYKGKLTLEQRAICRRMKAARNGLAAEVEQVAAWLKINERKTCKARRFLKSANSDQKTDHREYLRFKQEHGWRRLSVYKSGIHALGLYTAEFIERGEMVVEYVGEIVGLRVADKREADYHSGRRMQYQKACYLFRVDKERIIDATRKGGIARFVNHSCSPNCVAKVICVKNENKVVFFAQRDIYAGEEITYDYQFQQEPGGDEIPCFCGSADCRGRLN